MLMNETDLHYKVVDYIRKYHKNAVLNVGLREMQDTSEKRVDAYRKGYTSGQPDITIMNLYKHYSGFCIELKTPWELVNYQIIKVLHLIGTRITVIGLWFPMITTNFIER